MIPKDAIKKHLDEALDLFAIDDPPKSPYQEGFHDALVWIVRTGLEAEEQRLRAWLQNIVQIHELAPELFTSDLELANSLASRAQAALDGKVLGED
jgi:hypothetical protein